MKEIFIQDIRKAMLGYCQNEYPSILSWIANVLVSHITGYNYSKYWKRRAYVINPEKKSWIKKSTSSIILSGWTENTYLYWGFSLMLEPNSLLPLSFLMVPMGL